MPRILPFKPNCNGVAKRGAGSAQQSAGMAEECRRPISKNRRMPMIDETPRSIADLAVRGPLRRESATRAPLNCGPERNTPVSRPATRDQAIFVEYLVQKLVHLNSVMSEFAGCVSNRLSR